MDSLPNLVVIGALKCGTGSLHYYLDLHPEISMSRPKELNFFIDEDALVSGGEIPADQVPRATGKWGRGPDWYRSQFRAATAIRGESSPLYTSAAVQGERIAARMAEVVPEARIIYLVREPVERALSHWRQRRTGGTESRGCSEALAEPGNLYIATGRYRTQLRPFLERYAGDRILIVASEELRDHRRETISRIFAHLGVDDSFWSEDMSRLRNVGGTSPHQVQIHRFARSRPGGMLVRATPHWAKWQLERLLRLTARSADDPGLDPALRRRLSAELAPEAEGIQALAGRAFPGWGS